MSAAPPILQTTLADRRPDRQGKVRDIYDFGNRLLIAATDRISAFDYVLASGIPDKGKVLTQISTFWFERTTVTRFIDEYADDVMFESDFPHPTSLSPGPVSHTDSPDKVIEANLSSLSDEVLNKILHGTAERIYNLETSLTTAR